MDENGDAEGNYSLIARKALPDNPGEYGLFPVGIFTVDRTNHALPVREFYRLFIPICFCNFCQIINTIFYHILFANKLFISISFRAKCRENFLDNTLG